MTGIIGMLSGVASGATDGADTDYWSDWSPYVTLRGGWVFGGKIKYSDHLHQAPAGADGSDTCSDRKKNLGGAWSGSGEFGVSICEDRVSVGLELGYFAGKAKHAFDSTEFAKYPNDPVYFPAESYAVLDGKYRSLFVAVNVTLKKDVGERSFLYGGVGAGMARSNFGEFNCRYADNNPAYFTDKIDFKTKWRLLTQAFAGAGVYLNDNWSLTFGYRLRYLPGDGKDSKKLTGVDAAVWNWKIKQNLLHAAEIGLTYQF